MSSSKIFGALVWLIGVAIIVIYSSWVALQLVSFPFLCVSHSVMKLNVSGLEFMNLTDLKIYF
jgi:hypothetical protein